MAFVDDSDLLKPKISRIPYWGKEKPTKVKIPEGITFIPICLYCEEKGMMVRVNAYAWNEGRRVKVGNKTYKGVCSACWESKRP
jgi:hypothetical protein